ACRPPAQPTTTTVPPKASEANACPVKSAYTIHHDVDTLSVSDAQHTVFHALVGQVDDMLVTGDTCLLGLVGCAAGGNRQRSAKPASNLYSFHPDRTPDGRSKHSLSRLEFRELGQSQVACKISCASEKRGRVIIIDSRWNT